MMTENQSSYRQIMKATSIFGGVQVLNILISIVRSKFVAILLGPSGMGIIGLLTATTGMMGSLTNFGLGTSAVKDIATAAGTNDTKHISRVVNVIQRLVWITGLLGLVSTAIFSPWLSQITFGNKDYTLAFIWLSVTLLFNQLSSGQLVLLQGLRKLKHLAKANLSGSITGLFVTLPLYFIWGIDGIVPALIGSSLISLVWSWFYSKKIEQQQIQLTHKEVISEGKDMLKMGFMINLSLLFSVAASFLVRIFISHHGGIEEVGLYNAGFVIINTYVSLIFNAMTTDYYPRLSEVASDNELSKKTINQQAKIAILIMGPILMAFIVFVQWVIVLLYSNQFISVSELIYWAALGMFFKAASWAVAFLFLAKGNSKIFFWTECISNIFQVIFNIAGYYLGGLNGLGLSFAFYYLSYLILVYIVCRIKYDFHYDHTFLIIFSILFGLAIFCFLTNHLIPNPYHYIVGSLIIICGSVYSLYELNRRINFNSLLQILRIKK